MYITKFNQCILCTRVKLLQSSLRFLPLNNNGGPSTDLKQSYTFGLYHVKYKSNRHFN